MLLLVPYYIGKTTYLLVMYLLHNVKRSIEHRSGELTRTAYFLESRECLKKAGIPLGESWIDQSLCQPVPRSARPALMPVNAP